MVLHPNQPINNDAEPRLRTRTAAEALPTDPESGAASEDHCGPKIDARPRTQNQQILQLCLILLVCRKVSPSACHGGNPEPSVPGPAAGNICQLTTRLTSQPEPAVV